MSYILDALRKADADRERGAVPDLNAQPMATGARDFGLPERSAVPWGWLLAGIGLALVAAMAWRIVFPARTAPPPLPPVPAPMTAPAPTPAPPAAPAAPQVGPALPAAPPPSATPSQAAAPASAALPAAPPRKERRVVSGTVSRRATPAEASPQDGAAAAAARPASAQPEKLPRLAELPEPVRRGVPALAIGGAVYSPQPEARMVIVNGEVVREGQAIAPGLQLEQIRPRSAVFSIRGQRFEVPL